MREIFIPIADTLITNPAFKGRHQLSQNETPMAINGYFEGGAYKKRLGISEIYGWDTGDKILGYYKANSDYSILSVYDASADTTRLIEWNNDVSTPVMTTLESGFDTSAWWHFVKHYDTSAKCQGTSNQGVIVCTNGVNNIRVYNPNAAVGAKIDTLTTSVRGTFVQSRSGVLYLANMWNSPFGASDYLQFRVGHSYQDDATRWVDPVSGLHNYKFDTRPESASFISGLIRTQGGLILAKTDELWPFSTYLAFGTDPIKRGLSSPFGYISSQDGVVIDNNRKIETIDGLWLSEPIHDFFAAAGEQGDITAVEDDYLKRHLWATANYICPFNLNKKVWNIYEYGENVRLLGNMQPYDKTFDQWIGLMSDHTGMTIGEEQITPDYLIAYNDNKLCMMNHFSKDQIGGRDIDIEMKYQTPWKDFDAPSRYKRLLKLIVLGTPSTAIKIRYATSMYPDKYEPAWTQSSVPALQTLNINSSGVGHLDIDILSNYFTVEYINKSQDPCNINALGFWVEDRESII